MLSLRPGLGANLQMDFTSWLQKRDKHSNVLGDLLEECVCEWECIWQKVKSSPFVCEFSCALNTPLSAECCVYFKSGSKETSETRSKFSMVKICYSNNWCVNTCLISFRWARGGGTWICWRLAKINSTTETHSNGSYFKCQSGGIRQEGAVIPYQQSPVCFSPTCDLQKKKKSISMG